MDSICFDSCHHDFLNPYDMNIQEKRKRLQELLENNIKNEDVGTAIAITGSWGVGKTYFWNKLLEDIRGNDSDNVLSKRKYAYISLFGIESLSDLKTQIYSNIENHHLSIEVPKWLKSLPSIFKDTRITQLGINAPVKLIDNLLFNQVKDAIICFDDFERMSNKLDIKDVMGLANQLKLEKNCQVILILDESKAEGENKSKYAEYKEKLIDETIIINSVEPLIREFSQGMDERLIELMIKFADSLEIHNFRFFQKVINLYKKFRKELPDEVAYSTKEIILIRILQGYFIEDFGEKFEFRWEDIKVNGSEESREHWSKNKIRTFTLIEEHLPPYFLKLEGWVKVFKSEFDQVKKLNHDVIRALVESDLISENYQNANMKIVRLINKYKAFDIDSPSTFVLELFDGIKGIYKFEIFENIEFYCSILADFDANHLINDIDKLLQDYIKQELISNREQFLKKHYWHGNKSNKFRQNIEKTIQNTPSDDKYALSKVVKLYIIKGEIQYGTEEVLHLITKDNLRKFILEIYLEEFNNTSLKAILEVVLMLYSGKCISRKEEIKDWMREILEEKGEKHKYPSEYMKYITENLY